MHPTPHTCASISSLEPMLAGTSAPSTRHDSGKFPLKCFVSTSSVCSCLFFWDIEILFKKRGGVGRLWVAVGLESL